MGDKNWLRRYPSEWVQHCFACSRHDPVMAYCANQVVPICWSDLAHSLLAPSRQVMADAASHGLVAGLIQPKPF